MRARRRALAARPFEEATDWISGQEVPSGLRRLRRNYCRQRCILRLGGPAILPAQMPDCAPGGTGPLSQRQCVEEAAGAMAERVPIASDPRGCRRELLSQPTAAVERLM